MVNPAMQAVRETATAVRSWGSVVIACAITLYFFRQNLIGIHESSGKALKIMIATTIMAVVMLVWCGVTLLVHGPVNRVPLTPDLTQKVEYQAVQGVDRVTGERREIWRRDSEPGKLVPKMETRPARPPSSTRPPAGRKTRWDFIGRMSPVAGRQAAAAGQLVEHDRH